MNINYGFLTTIYESSFAQMYILLVENMFCNVGLKIFIVKRKKIVNNTRISVSEDTVETTWDPLFGHFGSKNLQNIHQIYIDIIILQFSY